MHERHFMLICVVFAALTLFLVRATVASNVNEHLQPTVQQSLIP